MTESDQLTLFAEDSHVSRTQEQTGRGAAEETLETCQARLSAWYQNLSQPSLLEKTPRALLILGSHPSLMTWRRLDISRNHSLYQLALLDYLRWNGMYGLLPRPAASDYKGSSMKRYRTSKHYKGNYREAIRESESDGTYPNPEFTEAVKGFPIGHTEIKR